MFQLPLPLPSRTSTGLVDVPGAQPASTGVPRANGGRDFFGILSMMRD